MFSLRTYDSLNPNDNGFLKDYENFNSKVLSLDRFALMALLHFCFEHSPMFSRKLGAILGRAFEDCIVSESLFKLLYIFGRFSDQTMNCNEIPGSLADRKLIATELTEKMPLLLDLLNNEMDRAKEIFDQQEVFFWIYPFLFLLLLLGPGGWDREGIDGPKHAASCRSAQLQSGNEVEISNANFIFYSVVRL